MLSTTWVAGVTGLEPAASGVTGRRSNQLSYTPNFKTVVPERAPKRAAEDTEDTGENAAREKLRSISSQTCCRPAWMTLSVIGSRLTTHLQV